MKNKNGLFIFHRDFRLIDNTSLIDASKKCESLHLCFIFTPTQVTDINKYRSDNSIQFMIESLKELQENINGTFNVFYGENENVLNDILRRNTIDAVFFNIDYSPFAIKRDEMMKNICNQNNIVCHSNHDYYLYQPGTIQTKTGGYYKKYTPFMNTVINKRVKNVNNYTISNISKTALKINKT